MGQVESLPRVDEPTSLSPPGLFEEAVGAGEGDALALRLLIDGEWRERAAARPSRSARPSTATRSRWRRRPAATMWRRPSQPPAPPGRGSARCPRPSGSRSASSAAELMAEHHDSFVDAIVVDLGKTPSRRSRRSRPRGSGSRWSARRSARSSASTCPGDWIPRREGQVGRRAARARGHRGRLRPVQLPAVPGRLEDHPGARGRQHGRGQGAVRRSRCRCMLFVRVLEEAGLPAGVLNVITGRGGEIGDLLACHQDISMISFTGSIGVGPAASPSRRARSRCTSSSGGNAAAIVLADADLDLAVEKSVIGAFKNAGQRCDAVSRVLVEARSTTSTSSGRSRRPSGGRWAIPARRAWRSGPLVNDRRGRAGAAAGATTPSTRARSVLVGGELRATPTTSPPCWPTCPSTPRSSGRRRSGRCCRSSPVADLDEALEVANRSRYGLDSAVFTSNLDNAWRAARALECGRSPSTTRPPTASATSRSAAASPTRGSAARDSGTRSTSAPR